MKFIKIHIAEFITPHMQTYLHLRCRLNGNVSWQISWANIFYSSSMDNTSYFFINLPRPAIVAWKLVSSPSTLTWWNLESVKILKKTTCALPNSTTHCCCHCLKNLPISHIKYLNVVKKQNKKSHKVDPIQKPKTNTIDAQNKNTIVLVEIWMMQKKPKP